LRPQGTCPSINQNAGCRERAEAKKRAAIDVHHGVLLSFEGDGKNGAYCDMAEDTSATLAFGLDPTPRWAQDISRSGITVPRSA
jgi:hypothetical protein